MGGRALEGVANAHRNRHVHALVRQRIGRLFSLRAVVKRVKIIENGIRVRFCLLFWVFCSFLCHGSPIFLSHCILLFLMLLFHPLSPV